MTKLEELKAKHAELKKQIVDESKAFFKEATQAFFAKYPTVNRFSWTQYTPYFNDGDECVFRVNEEPEINGKDSYETEESDGIPSTAFAEAQTLISEIDESTMKEMFGDHVQVTALRSEIIIDEYSHD